MSTQPTVLVVEDERELAALYASWLRDEYEVVTAADGGGALEAMRDAVDVVLLDRNLPDLSGDDVLERIRAAGHDCWVIMVTAVDPGLDVVELDLDEYLTKPVSRVQLTRVIENLRAQSRLNDDGRRELSALSSDLELGGEDRSDAALEETAAYQQLEAELEALGEQSIEDRTATDDA